MVGATTLVLDSGVGGLSVLAKLLKAFPEKHFSYLGDTLCFPYGDRPLGSLRERLELIIKGFSRAGSLKLDSVVLACHTATLAMGESVEAEHNVFIDQEGGGFGPDPADPPVYGMIEPVVRYAYHLSHFDAHDRQAFTRCMMASALPIRGSYDSSWPVGGRSFPVLFSVLGTRALASSCAYSDKLGELGGVRANIFGCQDLVSCVEDSVTSGPKVEAKVQRYLNALPAAPDCAHIVVLGCTHFSFLKGSFEKLVGEKTGILDPADCLVPYLRTRVPFDRYVPTFSQTREGSGPASGKAVGNRRGRSSKSERVCFYTSGNLEVFRHKVCALLRRVPGAPFDRHLFEWLDIGHEQRRCTFTKSPLTGS